MTERQKEILDAVIREFMKNADAVGSNSIVANYRLRVSPATVRNELVELSEQGYLDKSHFSAGRIPTDLGLRFFIRELMEEEPMASNDEVKVKIMVFNNRFDVNQLLEKVLNYLSNETGYAGIALFGETIRFSGLSTLSQYTELRNVEILNSILYLLENNRALRKIFDKAATDDVCLLIGKETDYENMQNCAFAFTPVDYVGGSRGYVGILGPRRMNYPRVVPLIRSVKQLVESSIKGW